MKKTILIDSSKTSDGGTITLHQHDQDFIIRVNNQDLMSTRQNHSETELAKIICLRHTEKDIQVLVGGLGFGGTLRSVLENTSKNSTVTTAELMPSVIKWNEDPRIHEDRSFLDDPRSTIKEGDVSKIIRRSIKAYDAIILDVDNGPDPVSVNTNNALYNKSGLMAARAALKPGGTLGIWSASASDQFKKLMEKCGFQAESIKSRSRPEKGSIHTLFIGQLK